MRTVLVVEDNADNLQIISYALQRAGYKVLTAETGEEGVDMAIASRPFMIIMDINLPGIDGVEATRRIRASEADGSIPIIAITSYAMRGDREEILAAGCNGYIEKPFDPLSVVEKIHKLLGVAP